jgi:hypothetical protein
MTDSIESAGRAFRRLAAEAEEARLALGESIREHGDGLSEREIAAVAGVSRQTVRKMLLRPVWEGGRGPIVAGGRATFEIEPTGLAVRIAGADVATARAIGADLLGRPLADVVVEVCDDCLVAAVH